MLQKEKQTYYIRHEKYAETLISNNIMQVSFKTDDKH